MVWHKKNSMEKISSLFDYKFHIQCLKEVSAVAARITLRQNGSVHQSIDNMTTRGLFNKRKHKKLFGQVNQREHCILKRECEAILREGKFAFLNSDAGEDAVRNSVFELYCDLKIKFKTLLIPVAAR